MRERVRLFPRALAEAAKTLRIPALTIIEAEAFAKGAVALKKTPDALKHEGRSMTMMTCSAGHMPVRIGTTEQSN